MTIEEDLKNKKPIIGNNETLKKLRNHKINKVYLASNCPNKDTYKRYEKTFDIEVIELKQNNKQLGGLCKKPFSISVMSFEK